MQLSPPRKLLCDKEAGERGKKKVGGVLWEDAFSLFPLLPRHLLYTGTTTQAHRLGYPGTTTNLHIILNTQKISNQIKPPKEIPVSKISNPKKSLNHSSPSIEIRSTPPPPGLQIQEKAGWEAVTSNRILTEV